MYWKNCQTESLVCFPLFGPESFCPLLVEVAKINKKSQKHKDQVDLKYVGKAERCTQGFRQGNAEELCLIEDRNGLDHSNSFR